MMATLYTQAEYARLLQQAQRCGFAKPHVAVWWRWLAQRRGEHATRRYVGFANHPIYVLWEQLWHQQHQTGWPPNLNLRGYSENP